MGAENRLAPGSHMLVKNRAGLKGQEYPPWKSSSRFHLPGAPDPGVSSALGQEPLGMAGKVSGGHRFTVTPLESHGGNM